MPQTINPSLRSAVLGAAIGDALGVPFEFMARDTFTCSDMVGYGTHAQPAGTWSDDTALLLATADSIRSLGYIDTADMRAGFRAWFEEGLYTPDGVVFDYGITTSRALEQRRGCDGEYDNGNGSLMRIAPLAFADANDAEVRAVSAITHAHEISCDACVSFVHLLRRAASEPKVLHDELAAQFAETPREEIRSGGFVRDTLRAAQWCFATTNDYASCVLTAVNLGDDTDTTACVAGALAGTAYGAESIPEAWVETLRGKDVLEDCLF